MILSDSATLPEKSAQRYVFLEDTTVVVLVRLRLLRHCRDERPLRPALDARGNAQRISCQGAHGSQALMLIGVWDVPPYAMGMRQNGGRHVACRWRMPPSSAGASCPAPSAQRQALAASS
jgi:hypothetical protein